MTGRMHRIGALSSAEIGLTPNRPIRTQEGPTVMAESIYQDPAVTLAPQQPEPAHASQGEGVVQFRFPGARTIQTVTGIAAGVLLELIVCLNGGTEGPSTMERRAEWAKGIE